MKVFTSEVLASLVKQRTERINNLQKMLDELSNLIEGLSDELSTEPHSPAVDDYLADIEASEEAISALLTMNYVIP